MKRVIQSAFALSLFILWAPLFAETERVDEFLGLEEDLGLVSGPQKFTSEKYHKKKDWQVKKTNVVKDTEPFRGQTHSIIPWKSLDPETFLDIHVWLYEREYKDSHPDWAIHLRKARHTELMGKVLKCPGTCKIMRGLDGVNSQYLSRVLEGDEVSTDKKSSAWIFMMDGTLLRIGANTSVSFHEINLTKDQVYTVLRLNEGHIFWHPRDSKETATDFAPETDAGSLPLMLREANIQHFERTRFKRENDREHLAEFMDLEEGAIKDQMKELNALKAQNNPEFKLKSHLLLIAPNVTLTASHTSLDFVHVSGGKSFFKRRSESAPEDLKLSLRGYTKTEQNAVEGNEWIEVAASGREYVTLKNIPGELQVTELITRRIKTIELAREIWVRAFTLPLFKEVGDAKKLATHEGYHLWGEEISKRMDFLQEYTRRIETTNLKSKENLLARLEAAGEKQTTELSSVHYEYAINKYLIGLKTKYSDEKLMVREMTDLQYYVWILKNGKP